MACDAQGRPDFALASAGGKVVGHSLLAAEGRARWASALQRAMRLVPGGLISFVHPHADEVEEYCQFNEDTRIAFELVCGIFRMEKEIRVW